MQNNHPLIVSTLSNILPTYYELFADTETPKPCITYLEAYNADSVITKEEGYSTVIYNIKYWDSADAFDFDIPCQIDSAMRELGFKRNSTNEIVVDNMICKVMVFQGRTYEVY